VILSAVGLVWIATLGTRQHHLVDVLSGALMAWLVVMAFSLWERRRRAALPLDS
jgi:membrane-associated phospholipid phosphatase